ncbi:uncharacterized protein [Scyliorhinus torazame]|uniref:uncharacterized protein n=1 Tax=Scyliorhinus torazame TaxID=75743 RepID=UPI003B5C0D98
MGFRITSANGYVDFFALVFSITTNVAGFEVFIDTSPPALEFGDSLSTNCSTTCALSEPLIMVEYKPGINPIQTRGDKWKADYFPSVKAWDISVPCYVKCKTGKTANKVVTVYNREINITSPPEVLEVNRTYSLECIGPRVYPNNKLILTWLRGSETLQINSTGKQGFPDEDIRLRNVFSFAASVSDDGQEYTCLAEVDLGSNSTKPIANSSVTLRAHSIVTGFEIRLNTNPPAVEFGASLEMNCTTTCSNPIINVEYKPGIHPNRTTGNNWITDYFPSVQAWDFTAPCNVICKSQNNRADEQKKVVTVYNREINITSPPEVLEVNRTYSLECIGPRVYPNNKLILTWLRGNQTLQINSTGEQGFPDEDIRLRNVFSFTASVSDDGQEYTCLAEVDLGSNSTKPIANCSVTLRAHFQQHSWCHANATSRAGGLVFLVDRLSPGGGAAIVTGFEIRLNTNPPAVEFGASLEMNCTTTCPDPIINVEYKPGIHPNRTTGSNWITDYFPSVQAWDFTAPCNVICKSQNNSADEQKVVVTVYNREINITSPPEVLEVNRTYSLECIGPRVYPNNKLILTWLRGSETLQINSTGEQGFPDEDIRLRNVFSFTASVSDDGQEYTCLAEVDLGSNSTKPIANCSVTLRAHSFMDPPRIFDQRPVEVKQEVTLTCEVSNVYPVDKMRVRLFQDGEELNSTTWLNDNTVRQTAAWTPQVAGPTEIVCTAHFEEYPSVPPKNSSIFIVVYDKPGDTTISVNNKTVSGFPVTVRKGDEVTMICNSNGNPTPTLKWEDPSNSSNVEIGSPGVLRISHATSGHQGIYKCRATNRYGIEEKEVDIRVTDKPGDTTISVNNKTVSGFPVTVRKGDEVTMICNSNGNPTPTLKWEDPSNSSNVEIGSSGVLRISHATSGHQGIYKCRATNRYGIEEKEVDIRVTDKPGDTTISVNNKTVSGFPVTVRKGDEVTMICNSNGNPTPTLKWEDPSNSSNVEIGSSGVLRISHATSGHQGVYKCRATNRYGIEEKEVDIRVTDEIRKNWSKYVLISIISIIVIILIIIALLLRRNKNRKGTYSVQDQEYIPLNQISN